MKTTLHYRLIIIVAMMTANMQQLHAQYFQRQYNLDYGTHTYRNEYLESGVCTRFNYTGTDTNYYFFSAVGTSLSKYRLFPPVADSAYNGNRVRFIRNGRTGNLLNNKGYEFRKYNNLKWYNAEAHSICEMSAVAINSGYVITGSVTSNSKTGGTPKGGSDILFARLNSTGNIMASVSIDHLSSSEVGYCIKPSTAPLVAGTYLICGSVRISSVRTDAFVARVDSAGSVQWFKTFNMDTTYSGGPPTAHNIAYSLIEIPSEPDIIPSFWGEIHVVGTYQDASSSNLNGFWLRLDKNGNYITSARYFSPYPGPENDDVTFRSIKWTDDNNMVVTGSTNAWASGLGIASSGPHTLLVKLTPIIGGLLGTRILMATHPVTGDTIPSGGYDVIERLNTSASAEYYVSGFCTDISFLSARNIVFKTDLIGFPIAQYLFAESNFPVANSIDFVRNTIYKPGFALFSSAQSIDITTPTISDSYIAKAYFNGRRCTNDSSAQLPRWYQLNVPAAPTLIDTTIEFSVTQLASRSINYQTILICNQGTISGGSNARNELNSDEEKLIEEMHLYPNPAVDNINVNVTVNENQEVKISVFDVSGKMVLEEFSELEAGESLINLSIEELPKGFYILQLNGKQIELRNKFIKN